MTTTGLDLDGIRQRVERHDAAPGRGARQFLASALAADVTALLAEIDRLNRIDVDKLRELAGALNRAEAKYPNPFYVGFGAAILAAINEPTDYLGRPVEAVLGLEGEAS